MVAVGSPVCSRTAHIRMCSVDGRSGASPTVTTLCEDGKGLPNRLAQLPHPGRPTICLPSPSLRVWPGGSVVRPSGEDILKWALREHEGPPSRTRYVFFLVQ